MLVYLDTNILGFIEAGKLDVQTIIAECNLQEPQFPYSTIHLFEAKQIPVAVKALDRCQTMLDISKGLYLNHSLSTNKLETTIVQPNVVYKDVYWDHIKLVEESIEQITSIFPQQQEMQAFLQFTAAEMNKLTPIKLLDRLDTRFEELGVKSANEYITDEIKSNQTPVVQRMSKLIEYIVWLYFLDAFKFYPDKQDNIKSRLWDGAHAYYASSCDYFITADLRLSYKSSALFTWNKTKTQAILWKKGVFERI